MHANVCELKKSALTICPTANFGNDILQELVVTPCSYKGIKHLYSDVVTVALLNFVLDNNQLLEYAFDVALRFVMLVDQKVCINNVSVVSLNYISTVSGVAPM